MELSVFLASLDVSLEELALSVVEVVDGFSVEAEPALEYKSLYQPPPLNEKAGAETNFLSLSSPHTGQVSKGASEMD